MPRRVGDLFVDSFKYELNTSTEQAVCALEKFRELIVVHSYSTTASFSCFQWYESVDEVLGARATQ